MKGAIKREQRKGLRGKEKEKRQVREHRTAGKVATDEILGHFFV